MQTNDTLLKKRLLSLLDELLGHDGYGSIKIDIRLLRRGQKEVIIDCGKQYRFVIDFDASLEKNASMGH